ncbi:hypothetical protein SAMN05878482_101332 [Peribacillus simplex]|uniref:Uncharacterized protein n=1 Tax=Peribacillus simplex TaxID=1478 RepID=A0A9X8WH52_9BACI|nr:hypothetical protein SAMN05878482_101332 [Peribacillus simplex]
MGKGSTGRVEVGIDIDFKGIIELLIRNIKQA